MTHLAQSWGQPLGGKQNWLCFPAEAESDFFPLGFSSFFFFFLPQSLTPALVAWNSVYNPGWTQTQRSSHVLRLEVCALLLYSSELERWIGG